MSKLTILNNGNLLSTQVDINEGERGYKLEVHKTILSEAIRLKENPSISFTKNLVDLYREFGTSLLKNDNIDKFSSLVQTLFFHNGTINTVLRSYDSDQCDCTPDPGYFVGKKTFWCQEDYMINPKKLLNNFKLLGHKISDDNQIIKYLLSNQDKDEISIDHIYELESPKVSFLSKVGNQHAFIKNITKVASSSKSSAIIAKAAKKDCLEGSDLGCCANYEGCCWLSNMACLGHDLACLCCDYWWCLWGCKPEDLCNNT